MNEPSGRPMRRTHRRAVWLLAIVVIAVAAMAGTPTVGTLAAAPVDECPASTRTATVTYRSVEDEQGSCVDESPTPRDVRAPLTARTDSELDDSWMVSTPWRGPPRHNS